MNLLKFYFLFYLNQIDIKEEIQDKGSKKVPN